MRLLDQLEWLQCFVFLPAMTLSAYKGLWNRNGRKACTFETHTQKTHTQLPTIKDNDTQTNYFALLWSFRRRACISMLSPQHPFSPGSCVGPLRCGKILHAPGRPWPLCYGRQKLYVFMSVCVWERDADKGAERRWEEQKVYVLLWFHWQCNIANDFSSN